MSKQLNPINSTNQDWSDLDLFCILLPSFSSVLTDVWHRHCPLRNSSMRKCPHSYLRILFGIKLGFSRSQLAVLVGNNYPIKINALIRIGFLLPQNRKYPDWDVLVLSPLGVRTMEDLFNSIQIHINSVPIALHKKRGN